MKVEDKMCVRILSGSIRPETVFAFEFLTCSPNFDPTLGGPIGVLTSPIPQTKALPEEGFLFRFKELLVAALA